MKLTSAAIDKAPVGATLKDSTVPGLECRIFERRKSFYLYYRTKSGKQRRPKIGDLGVLTIPQARQIARDMLVEVAAGGDPQAERRQARGEPTVKELQQFAGELAVMGYKTDIARAAAFPGIAFFMLIGAFPLYIIQGIQEIKP